MNEPTRFFRSMHAAFDRAARAGLPETVVDLQLAAFSLRLRMIGPELPRLYLPALQHLEQRATTADLEILLWDTDGTSVAPPRPSWESSDHVARGRIPRYCDARVQTAFNIESGILNVIDQETNTAIQNVRSPARLPHYETAAPLREIINWWMLRRDRQVVHAGAVGDDRGGALLVGRGGSGKSSTTAVCLGARLRFVSDDYCLVRTDGHTVVASSLFDTLKLSAPDARQLEPVRHLPSVVCPTTGKHMFRLAGLRPSALTRELPIKVMLLPRVSGAANTTVAPVSPARSLRALAPSTLFQMPGSDHQSMRNMAQLVRALPAYQLELGTDRAGVVDAIGELLEAHR